MKARERADKVRDIGKYGCADVGIYQRLVEHLPPGSLILTAAEAEQVRRVVDWAHRSAPGDPSREALALLSAGQPEQAKK